jgi:bifunctional DNase/RNase
MARSPRRAPIPSLLCCFVTIAAMACDRAPPALETEVPVTLDRVAIDDHDSPVIVLEEEGGPRWLPIWIGLAEAHSIALEMEQRRLPRPNTHDLARSVIREMKGRVARVVVTELRGGTYYAILNLDVGGEQVEVDARPSDAIAIALRDGAPIFVRESLFDEVDASDDGPIEGEEPAPNREI